MLGILDIVEDEQNFGTFSSISERRYDISFSLRSILEMLFGKLMVNRVLQLPNVRLLTHRHPRDLIE